MTPNAILIAIVIVAIATIHDLACDCEPKPNENQAYGLRAIVIYASVIAIAIVYATANRRKNARNE